MAAAAPAHVTTATATVHHHGRGQWFCGVAWFWPPSEFLALRTLHFDHTEPAPKFRSVSFPKLTRPEQKSREAQRRAAAARVP